MDELRHLGISLDPCTPARSVRPSADTPVETPEGRIVSTVVDPSPESLRSVASGFSFDRSDAGNNEDNLGKNRAAAFANELVRPAETTLRANL